MMVAPRTVNWIDGAFPVEYAPPNCPAPSNGQAAGKAETSNALPYHRHARSGQDLKQIFQAEAPGFSQEAWKRSA